jgi:hypothetical protein
VIGGGMLHAQVMRSIELLAAEIAHAVRRAPAAGAAPT